MKDFLSKEHYCYKIYTSLTKSSAYPLPFYREAPIWITPYFYKNILIHSSMIFQKFEPLL